MPSSAFAVGQADRAQRGFVNTRAVFETVQRFEIDRNVTRAVAALLNPRLGMRRMSGI